MSDPPTDNAFRVNRGGSYLSLTTKLRPAIVNRPSSKDPPTVARAFLGFRTFRRVREVKP